MTTMTTTEVAAKLRQFNEWRRRGRDDIPQPKPCEIGKVIVAMTKGYKSVAYAQWPAEMHLANEVLEDTQ